MTEIVGIIRRRTDRSERLALYLADGTLSSSFAQDQTLDDVRELLAEAGYTVDVDGVVTKSEQRA